MHKKSSRSCLKDDRANAFETGGTTVDYNVRRTTSLVRFSQAGKGKSGPSEDMDLDEAGMVPESYFRSRLMSSSTDAMPAGQEYLMVGFNPVTMKNMRLQQMRSSFPDGHETRVERPLTTEAVGFGMVLCPYCREPVVLIKKNHIGRLNWVVSLGVCCMGGCLGCFLIPFCMDELKDVMHICPNCSAVLGEYKQLNY